MDNRILSMTIHTLSNDPKEDCTVHALGGGKRERDREGEKDHLPTGAGKPQAQDTRQGKAQDLFAQSPVKGSCCRPFLISLCFFFFLPFWQSITLSLFSLSLPSLFHSLPSHSLTHSLTAHNGAICEPFFSLTLNCCCLPVYLRLHESRMDVSSSHPYRAQSTLLHSIRFNRQRMKLTSFLCEKCACNRMVHQPITSLMRCVVCPWKTKVRLRLFCLFVCLLACLFVCLSLCLFLGISLLQVVIVYSSTRLLVACFAVNNTQLYIGPHPFLSFLLPSAMDHSLLSVCCLLNVDLRIFPWTFLTDEAVAGCNKLIISKQSPNKDNWGESSPFIFLVVIVLTSK